MCEKCLSVLSTNIKMTRFVGLFCDILIPVFHKGKYCIVVLLLFYGCFIYFQVNSDIH